MPKRKTTEEFKQDVLIKLGEDYEVIGEYINNKTKIKMKHVCGHIYESKPHDILQKGTGCPLCNGGRTKTLKEFLDILSDDYEYLGGFVNFTTSVKLRHKCGHEFEMLPKYIARGRGCPLCGGTKKLSHEEFINKVEDFSDKDEYEFITKYKNNKTKMLIKHITCGNTFEMTPNHFMRGQRCTQCDRGSSLACKRIYKLLSDKGLDFELEYSFNDFISKNNQGYKYDFYIPEKKLLIEYDGQQHFNEKAFGKRSFNRTRKNDKLKNEYVIKNNISLLRIPYKSEGKIEHIIEDILINGKSSETIEKFNLFFISETSDFISCEDEYFKLN